MSSDAPRTTQYGTRKLALSAVEETQHALRIGIDTGGTFTDFVVFNPDTGELTTFKLPSTPHNPALAVLEGIQRISNLHSPFSNLQITHGSTVATNALLERKGARTALITTKGFRDVLAIGRQNRPALYDLTPTLPPPLVPDELRFEVDERVDAQGNVLIPLTSEETAHCQLSITNYPLKIESVAICLLFSFLRPEHEAKIAEKLRTAGYFVSSSHEILPEYREYERTATTVVNAYVSPIMDRYLGQLEDALESQRVSKSANLKSTNQQTSTYPLTQSPILRPLSGRVSNLQIMQSNGGIISPAQARREAVRCILSGPAGGLVAAQNLPHESASQRVSESAKLKSAIPQSPNHETNNQQSPISNLLTFDMGGTSTDVSLIQDTPTLTTEAEIGGLPIRVPVLDIHTIGAGGGSIAWIDPGGGLQVGPQSAGADPGPASYGRTSHLPPDTLPLTPTVTDANLFLNRLLPDHFLGGQMPLYPNLAQAAIAPLAAQLGLTPIETALGIIAIANAHMARALRVISVERGHDPADFTLVSFGGAGGLHAADLARELGIPRVLISPYASVFSALGMLMADVVKDYSQTVMLPGNTPISNLQFQFSNLLTRARANLLAESISEDLIALYPQLDVRFRGQSYELTIPFTETWQDTFDETYRATYGYAPMDGELEIVNLRVHAVGRVPSPEIKPAPRGGSDPAPALLGTRAVYLDPAPRQIPVYDGERLTPGNQIPGPALVIRPDTTILLSPSDLAEVDSYHNLLIQIYSPNS